jgi:hypothetical protein
LLLIKIVRLSNSPSAWIFSVVMATEELRRGRGTKFLVVQTLTIKKKRLG